MTTIINSSALQRVLVPVNRQRLVIFGATGSVGVNTLDVVARHPDRFEVVALAANARVEHVCSSSAGASARSYAAWPIRRLPRSCRRAVAAAGLPTRVLAGPHRMVEVATRPEVDTVMAAIVGAAGLPATLAAARAGKRVLLANKEALVMAGRLFLRRACASGAQLLPIDSEHNAIMQSLPADFAGDLQRRRRAAHIADGLRRAVPAHAARALRARDAGRGVRASELGRWAARSRWIRPP